ncbi:hypothetical protein RR48_05332 [Papilio machaon]|uniref:Uncharacterized protein n=1 Tax=Papilio machaon TaxID=76193 RepID=A0A0N1PIL6_PAPMA|nr:hypothetical protein RR48_05332 [Papilio machaon]
MANALLEHYVSNIEDWANRYKMIVAGGNKAGCFGGPVCGGQCCGRRRETELKVSLKRMMEDRAISATRPIAELLLATRRTLQALPRHVVAAACNNKYFRPRATLISEQLFNKHSWSADKLDTLQIWLQQACARAR